MYRQCRNHRHEIGIVVLFISFFILQLVLLMSGYAWVYLDSDQFSFYMLISVAMLAIVAGIVATYSFVQYTQEGSLRSFIMTLLGANVVLLAFLYLLTHPVTTWSVFSDRQRNLTIVTSLGFLVAPGVLGGSLVGHRPLTLKSKYIALFWGACAQPFGSLLLLMSPDPLFTLTSVTGFGNLSFAGWLFSIIYGVSTSLSLVRYLREWFRKHESITLASSLALVLWILSFLIFLTLDRPIQIAELLWFNGVAYGFLLLAVTMIITSIIEPHKALESLIKERTAQLEESREETEFYLRLWTHKIGNLLQGIHSYLELIGFKAGEFPSLSDYQKMAVDLVRESTSVNRQVERLVRIKEKETSVTWPVKLSYVLSEFEKMMKDTVDDESLLMELPLIDNQLQIVADDLIDILFSNLVSKCARQHKETSKSISIRMSESKDQISLIFTPCSAMSISEISAWSEHRPQSKNSVVDLDLFMIWLLMERYGGGIEHKQCSNSQEGELVLTFRKA